MKKGFTLLEVTVVMAIMIIMLSVGMVSLNSSKRSASLKAAQNEVTAAIKLAQSYALQGRIPPGEDDAPCEYGFKFIDNDTYSIFFRNDCATGVDQIISSERKDLKNGAYLNDPNDVDDSRITFSVPHGTPGGSGLTTFTFCLNGVTCPATSKTIEINSKGLIIPGD